MARQKTIPKRCKDCGGIDGEVAFYPGRGAHRCKSCTRADVARRYQANREELQRKGREYNRLRWKANPERERELARIRDRRRRARNPEHVRALRRKNYHQRKADRFAAKTRQMNEAAQAVSQ